MPFELTFEEPPAVAARGVLPEDRRATLRRAIGEKMIARARDLLEIAIRQPGDESELIRLHESGLLEDLKHDWMAEPVLELFEAVARVSTLNLTDDQVVGRQLRRETASLVGKAEIVAELIGFLDLFAPSTVHTFVRPACTDGLTLTSALVAWMTTETDEESLDRAESFDSLVAGVREHYVILCGLPFADQIAPYDPDSATATNEFELLFRVEFPPDARRWIDVYRHLEEAGYDLCQLGGRQLPYFGEYRATDPIWSRNFFDLARRIGISAFPMLAHRAAYLTWRLLAAAVATNESETLATLHALFDEESLWMIASQEDYEGARSRYLAGDQGAIVEAYADLTEGTLRRYASLIVALERICAGHLVQQPLVLDTVGDVETQLRAWSREALPSLILRFLERGLRNADAHANVIVDEHGNLRVRLRDGTTETVEPNQVYGRTAGLRSLLDGVDIAMNHASIRDTERTIHDWEDVEMPPMSARTFEHVVQEFAEEHTPGTVSGVTRRDDVLTMTFSGSATYDELRTFANSLTRLLLPDLPTIHIMNEQGDPIEIFRPPPRRAQAGRNDSCPCGSGKKYTRCHGA